MPTDMRITYIQKKDAVSTLVGLSTVKEKRSILSGIDFVRIYTAVNQQIGGGVGEISTEISDVQDLHPSAVSITEKGKRLTSIYYQNGELIIESETNSHVYLYNTQGLLLTQWQHESGNRSTSLNMEKGIYIIRIGNKIQKIHVE